jgi:hypothetical protein
LIDAQVADAPRTVPLAVPKTHLQTAVSRGGFYIGNARRVLRFCRLPAFDKVAPVITDANGVYGIKIRARIFYRDFRSKRNQRPHVEILEVFAPYDLVEKFFNHEITNQKLVDGSIVLVNGDRIAVDMSKAAQI